jgi:hypothetical protein
LIRYDDAGCTRTSGTDLAQDPARVKSPSAGKTMIVSSESSPLTGPLQDKLAEIADKCPVAKSAIVTSIETAI